MIMSGDALAWIEVLGWSLLHFVWQGLLVGLLFALARSLIGREHSNLRYAVGLLSLAMLALCPPLTLWILRPQDAALASGLGAQVSIAGPAMTLASPAGSGMALNQLLPVLVLVWMIGVIVMISRAIHQWRALDHIATRLAYRQADIEALLLRVADRFGGMHGTRVLISKFIDTPTLIGWFKPVILLPAAVAVGFPRQQLELILAHELGHLRRLDHLVNLGQAVVETLLFYHPVVHWISREIRHEREICCDNLVLSLTDSEPSVYARTLAALEDVRLVSPQLAVAASGGMLLDRVRRIVGAAGPRKGNRNSLTVVCAVVAGCALAISAVVVLQPTDSRLPAEAFDQPLPLDVSIESPGVALNPGGDSLELLSIGAPVSAEPAASEKDSTELVDGPGVASLPASPVRMQVSPPALLPATPIADQLDSELLTMPEIASLETQPASAEESSGSSASRGPVLLHQVAPDYPDNGRNGSHARVGFQFSIDRNGRVRDIRVVSGDTKGTFAIAARDALRQWRFDPQSISDRGTRNFRQDFEFVSKSRALADEEGDSCITPTGSHLCRPGRGTGLAFKAEERAASISSTDDIAAQDPESEVECVPHTGSRVCRQDIVGPLAMESERRPETAAHTIVLKGGAP